MRTNMLEALSDNIVIDKDKCTFCGICVETCILDNLRLKLAPCRQACPLGVNCQGYVQMILRGQDQEALAMVERELPFPAILGRLCSAQCEAGCHHKKIDGEAVAIRALKRYLTDKLEADEPRLPEMEAASGQSVAIVGSGPAGMVAAFDLLKRGHGVTLIDSETEPGGMLRWAIPEFRLPGPVLAGEWGKLEAMGARFQGGVALDRDISLDELDRKYDAVIVATGCTRPRTLDIEGEDLAGVVYALDILKAVRSGQSPRLGEAVVVIGGGEVALDAAHTALRLGAKQVSVVSLEGEDEMPASSRALDRARAEDIELDGAWGPTRFLSSEGKLSGVEMMRCLAVFDTMGRFAPSFDDCELKTLRADTAIIAVGQEADPVPDCDPHTLQTEQEKVFLAGDAVGGPSSIVEAMASGRQAAESVHRLLTGEHLTYGRAYPGPVETEFEIDISGGSEERRVRLDHKELAGAGDFAEIEQGLSQAQAQKEASRCYSCGQPFGKFRTCWFCLPCEVECPNEALWVDIPYLLR